MLFRSRRCNCAAETKYPRLSRHLPSSFDLAPEAGSLVHKETTSPSQWSQHTTLKVNTVSGVLWAVRGGGGEGRGGEGRGGGDAVVYTQQLQLRVLT